jgi:hypothetical protein
MRYPPQVKDQKIMSQSQNTQSDLDQLEAQSIFILREAYSRLKPITMLWSRARIPTSWSGWRRRPSWGMCRSR